MQGLIGLHNSVSSATGGSAGVYPEARLSVPAGALEEDTQITTTRIALPPSQENIVPIQAAYSFGPEDLQFLKPATLEICYNPDELASKNLKEETVQIVYHNPQNGELASVGGEVNPSTHCVTAQVQHFSTYLAAAIALAPGNNAPVIGGATFLPSTAIVGMPLRVSTTVTDFAADASGAISSVYLYYRFGAGAYTKVAMQPDPTVTGSQTYFFTIPHTQMVAGTLRYYIEATDNLGKKRLRPTTAPATPSSLAISATVDGAAPLRITPTTNPFYMAAGFGRDFTTQVRRSTGAYLSIAPDSFSAVGGAPTASGPSLIRLLAQTTGAGSVSFTAGPYSISKAVTVSAGQLQKIEILDNAGVILTNPVNVKAGNTYRFDVLGYDAYGNTMLVLASLSLSPAGLGSIVADGTFTASTTYPQSGTLTASFDGFTDSAAIDITNPNPPAAAPLLSPAPGAYSSDQSVSLTSATPGATIYYTTDGSDPTASSTVYSGPISVAGNGTNMTIKAIAVAPPFLDSSITSGTYSITYLPADTPVFSPAPGTYSAGQFITITSTTPGAAIYYTLDGSTPTIWSPVYSGPVLLTTPTTLKSIAVKAGMLDSTIASGIYSINDTSAPTVVTMTPASGATNVSPLGATITVEFSEPMNTGLTPTLITEAHFGSTWNSVPNAGSSFVWTSPTLLTIKLSWIRFPENTEIRWFLLKDTLQDWAGHNVASDVMHTFVTRILETSFPVADTGQLICYAAAGSVIPCAGSGQDGDFADVPASRSFSGPVPHPVYLNDFVSTDNVTGLTWSTCVEGLSGFGCGIGTANSFTWYSAINACAAMNVANGGDGYGGRVNWRLPTVKELETLPNYGVTNPAIDAGAFPGTVSDYYWAATIATTDTQSLYQGYAWSVFFGNGYVAYDYWPLLMHRVRCVSAL